LVVAIAVATTAAGQRCWRAWRVA